MSVNDQDPFVITLFYLKNIIFVEMLKTKNCLVIWSKLCHTTVQFSMIDRQLKLVLLVTDKSSPLPPLIVRRLSTSGLAVHTADYTSHRGPPRHLGDVPVIPFQSSIFLGAAD